MSSLPEPPPPVDFYSILLESKRILSAHRRHFLGLSVLFLLPLSFFSNIYFTLSSQFNHNSQSLLLHHSPTTVSLIYSVVSVFFSILSVGTISFSVYHISMGRRPVKLVSSILSLLRSFLPLLSTSLASLLLQSLMFLAFGLILFLIIIGFELTVFQIDQSSSPFLFLSLFILGVPLLLVLIYLKVSWALASIIAVVESSWGFESLRRSTKLVKGMRRLVLSLMMFNGICSGALVFGCSLLLGDDEFDGDVRSLKSWLFVLRTVVITGGVMVIMLLCFVANTVLYMYCKAVNGGEIAAGKEVDGEYVSLPFDDDGKVLRYVISVAQNNELGMV